MSPGEALERLMEGNRRFLGQRRELPDYREQLLQTARGQYPFAAVLGCIDSRAPAELIFDQGIGDIFNVRVAGNIVNKDILGSLEFACKVAGSKLILVMGHTDCGAVSSAVDQVELGHLTSLLPKISPALQIKGDAPLEVDEVARKNVLLSVRRIREESEILADMESRGQIRIQGAMYDVATGKVSLVEE